MKLATFFISITRRIFTKVLGISESSIRIKVNSHWKLFVIFFTAAVICKQRILHGNEIVRYLQNCKGNSIDHFKKPI